VEEVWLNTVEKLAAAAMLVATSVNTVQAGDLRSWLLAGAPAGLARTRFIAARRPTLDGRATSCLACHDGRRATYVAVRGTEGTMLWGASGSAGHPVGMNYARAAAHKPAEYVPLARLDPAIRLVEGRVTCLSCHKLAESYQPRDPDLIKAARSPGPARPSRCTASSKLTVGPRRSDLCLSCHVM